MPQQGLLTAKIAQYAEVLLPAIFGEHDRKTILRGICFGLSAFWLKAHLDSRTEQLAEELHQFLSMRESDIAADLWKTPKDSLCKRLIIPLLQAQDPDWSPTSRRPTRQDDILTKSRNVTVIGQCRQCLPAIAMARLLMDPNIIPRGAGAVLSAHDESHAMVIARAANGELAFYDPNAPEGECSLHDAEHLVMAFKASKVVADRTETLQLPFVVFSLPHHDAATSSSDAQQRQGLFHARVMESMKLAEELSTDLDCPITTTLQLRRALLSQDTARTTYLLHQLPAENHRQAVSSAIDVSVKATIPQGQHRLTHTLLQLRDGWRPL